jgi:CheY-like chemotaxis protein
MVTERQAGATKSIDVLVVDDDFDLRDTLQEILEDFGYDVAVASDGLEALAWLRSHELPRLVLLDWMMPVCDGASFREAQLADERLASVPVVLLTADIRLDEKTKSLNANAYVKKPVELDTLLETIRRHSRT